MLIAEIFGNGKAKTHFHPLFPSTLAGGTTYQHWGIKSRRKSEQKSTWAAVLSLCQVQHLALIPTYPRFGHLNSQPRVQGDLITLSQSDKWLRQAKVIDGWNVTTTDTAIAFRKISRGSTRLSYPGWLVFLRELAETKRLPLPQVWARLEQVKPPWLRPALNSTLSNLTGQMMPKCVISWVIFRQIFCFPLQLGARLWTPFPFLFTSSWNYDLC